MDEKRKKYVMEGHTYIHTYVYMYGEVRVYASTYTTVREGGGREEELSKNKGKKQHTSLVACA